jgi:two-component system, NarL family, sensor kinase
MGNDKIDIYIMIIGATIVLLILLSFIIWFVFLYKNHQHRHWMEMQTVKEQYNQEILKAQLEIKEQTLRNISGELHDNFGQVLSLVILSLSSIDLDDRERAAAKVEDVTQLVEQVVRDLRNLSKSLDPENISKVGLPAIIRWELDLLEKMGIYRVSFEVDGPVKPFDDSTEIIVFRIVQEALNNIMKHSRASAINISLTYSADQLDIEIADDGKGFDLAGSGSKDLSQTGSGLHNMRKRSELIQASLDIKSSPEHGTRLEMKIPFITGQAAIKYYIHGKDKNSYRR